MTKADLTTEISNKMWVEGIPNDKLTITAVIDTFTSVVKDAVVSGDAVTLRGFGTFTPKRRGPRKGRNLKSNTVVDIPAQTVPVFLPAAEFAESVRLSQSITNQ